MDPVSIGLGLASAASALTNRGGNKRRRNASGNYLKAVRDANAVHGGKRAQGYTTREDEAAAERTRAKGTASAERSGALARTNANRSAIARGLSGASAAALQQRADAIVGQGREAAFAQGQDQLDAAFRQNRAFEENKIMTAWGNEVGALGQAAGMDERQAALDDSRQAEVWNSILAAIPAMQATWSAVPTAQTAAVNAAQGAATYNPAVSGIRQPRR